MNVDDDVIVNVGINFWDWLFVIDINYWMVECVVGICCDLINIEVVFDYSGMV